MSSHLKITWSGLSCLVSLALLLGCSDDASTEGSGSTETSTSDSSGDGDPGDGDPGDGDGDPGDGDPGDGDGDPGDGDGDPGPDEFLIGFDVRVVDPTQAEIDTINLGGYGSPFDDNGATAIHDSLHARTMALGYGEDDGMIVSVFDATGMGNQWTREIRNTASALTGLPADRIIIATTHSHAAPDFQGLWGGVGPGFRSRVIIEVTNSMLTAWDTRVPADLSVSNSSALNNNRRGWDMTDDSLVVMQAHRKSDAGLIGTMMTFAAHPVVIGSSNSLISRDYCGYAVDALEASTGAPVALFNGILGDVSPAVPQGMYADDFEAAAAYGEYIAAQAELMLDSAEPVEVDFHYGYTEWELLVDNILFNLAGQAGLLQYDFEQMGLIGMVVTQSTYVRIGTQIQLVSFPGEALTRLGLPIKDVMTAPYKVVLGNANDALGYFVPADEYNIGLNDNYEESIALSGQSGEDSRDNIIQLIEADVF